VPLLWWGWGRCKRWWRVLHNEPPLPKLRLPQPDSVKSASTTILQVDAFLLPLTLLGVPLLATSNEGLAGATPRLTTVYLLTTVTWLAASTLFGVGVMAILVFTRSIRRVWLSAFLWLEITFLVAGLVRLIFSFGSLTDFVLRKFG
jgi:hypothetical protein